MCSNDTLSIKDVRVSSDDGLVVRGRTCKKNNDKKMDLDLNQYPRRNNKCFNCNKEGHYMRNCPDCKENEKENVFNDGETKIVKENSNITYVLSVIINKLGDKWILNSKYSYYIFPNKDWFSTYQQIDGGKALLVNSVACKVVGVNII